MCIRDRAYKKDLGKEKVKDQGQKQQAQKQGEKILPVQGPVSPEIDYLRQSLAVLSVISHRHHPSGPAPEEPRIWPARRRGCLLYTSTRISAGCKMNGMNYSTFMHGLKLAGIDMNRKMLSEMAIHDPAAFTALCDMAKAAK